MRGSGGTEGGLEKFAIGFCLSALATYLFFDSVKVTSAGYGLIRAVRLRPRRLLGNHLDGHHLRALLPRRGGPLLRCQTVVGLAATYLGIGVIAIEILSRIQFLFQMKSTHLLGMIVLFAAGVGLMLRSYRDEGRPKGEGEGAKEDEIPSLAAVQASAGKTEAEQAVGTDAVSGTGMPDLPSL